ncbi:MAG: winged helix-turn-helix domain-containing protein, partial [Gammaproteobacteria bacterium]|nr:winged helix-turn-helix domain-containing protein [Gammaproteobacteria bacterium]
RVAGYLCSQVHGKNSGDGCGGFDLAAPKGVLASRLSVKPETFSRILHNLMDQDIISVKGGHIDVLDVDELRSIAQATDFCPKSIVPPPA